MRKEANSPITALNEMKNSKLDIFTNWVNFLYSFVAVQACRAKGIKSHLFSGVPLPIPIHLNRSFIWQKSVRLKTAIQLFLMNFPHGTETFCFLVVDTLSLYIPFPVGDL